MEQNHTRGVGAIGGVGALAIAFAFIATGSAPAQEDLGPSPFQFIEGPTTADLGGIARVEVPEGYRFAPQEDAQTLLEWMGNPTSGGELGLLVPEEGEWFLVFEFAPVGYIRDDEKDDLDTDEILGVLRKGNDAANRERKRRGWPQLNLLGWEQAPRYNPESHHLEWATRSSNGEFLVVNHNTRLLGRRGAMEVTLVCDETTFPTALPPARELLGGFAYLPGHTYGEYRKGDMVAAYGLTGLVAGGLAVAAAKSGLLGKLWKVLAFGVVGVVACARKLFGRRSPAQTAV